MNTLFRVIATLLFSLLLFVTVLAQTPSQTQPPTGTVVLEQEQVSLQQTTRDELLQSEATALEANKLSEVISPVDRIGVAAINRTTTASTDGTTVIDTVMTTKKSATAQATPSPTTNATGTGTQNQLAKWTDNAGTLGDSSMTDLGGLVGIGTTTPQTVFNVNQTPA